MDPDQAAALLHEYSLDRELGASEQITLAFHLLCGAARACNQVITVEARPDGKAQVLFDDIVTVN